MYSVGSSPNPFPLAYGHNPDVNIANVLWELAKSGKLLFVSKDKNGGKIYLKAFVLLSHHIPNYLLGVHGPRYGVVTKLYVHLIAKGSTIVPAPAAGTIVKGVVSNERISDCVSVTVFTCNVIAILAFTKLGKSSIRAFEGIGVI